MAYKPLIIIEKQSGTPAEIAVVTKRLSTPTYIQPSYTFDLSMMYGVFVPEVSFGNTFYWLAGYLEASVASGIGDATIQYVDGSLAARDAYIARINSSIGYLDASLKVIYPLSFSNNISIGYLDASLKQIYPLVFKINSSLGQYATNASVNLAFLTNSSLGNVSQLTYAHNTSIGWLDASMKVAFTRDNAQDVSIQFLDNARYLTKLRDVSVVDLGDQQLIHYDVDTSLWKNVDVINIDDFFTTREYIDGSLANKQNILTGSDVSTSTEIRFDKIDGHIYGTITAPINGPITLNSSNAMNGVVNLIIHNDVSLAAVSSFKKLAGYYDPCINNFIYIQYVDLSNQLYIIHQIQI